MNKKVIYIGLGAVVAYLLYKKFVAKPAEVKSEEVTEEPAAEEAPAGGGGGGGAAAPSASSEPVAAEEKTTKSAAIKPTSVMGLSAAQKPRNYGTAQRPSTSLTSSKPPRVGRPPMASQIRVNPKVSGKFAAPRATAVAARFDGYSDFDTLLTEERQPSGNSRIKPTSVSGLSVAQRGRNYGTAQRPTRPLLSKRVEPMATSARITDTMDFDGNNDVQGLIM